MGVSISDYHAMQARLDKGRRPGESATDHRRRLSGAVPLKMETANAAPGIRIRQDSKPLMNKLEAEWFAILSAQFPNYPRPRAQAKRYKLANGAWYRPDVTASSWPDEGGWARETAWECKGPSCMKNVARGLLAIKFAAAQWPEIAFWLVWKEKNQWKSQKVLAQ